MGDGTLVHGRNLDFAFPDVMRNITFIARFMDGDDYLFDSVMFAGYNSVLTAEKKGAFSISLNERPASKRKEPFGLLVNIGMIMFGYPQIGKLIRDTMA